MDIKDILNSVKTAFGTLRRKFLYYRVWPYYYKKYSKAPIDERKVVFAYAHSRKSLTDNMTPIMAELTKRGYNCVVIDRTDCEDTRGNKLTRLIRSFFDCREFFEAYGNCRALFLVDYYFPAFANKPREGQSVVQLWHGCGAFKMWGYSTADKAWGATKKNLDRYPIHNTYTHVCVSSPKVCFAYADAFRCDERVVVPLGTPRTDVFFDKEFVSNSAVKVREALGIPDNKKIILYAPTYRGNDIRHSYLDTMPDFDALYEQLHEDYVFLLKLHPLTAKSFRLTDEQKKKFDGFVYDISKGWQTDTALCAADIVISDYSSLIFEYALLERPMIFYSYDLEQYDNDRSFYFEYRSFVPGEIVCDTNGIINEVKRLETDFDVEKVRKFKNDFMSACDGNSTLRIIDEVLGPSR